MFQKKREVYIENLKVLFQEFEHECGTKHFHLSAENQENCFAIALPTLPKTHDGRAHILEHLALCGSKKYKTHDPFFAMTRRSLATFMNAMTYSDKTVYPFATTDKKDYQNLLSVYLDSVFFPNLDYYNFLQEGWRFEFDENEKLKYGGVVYNEMKGAFEDKYRHVYHSIMEELKKGTIYANESGGDPLHIPELKYEDLIDFHKTHYHPSRATIMTFGNITAEEIQSYFEAEVISKISTRYKRVYPTKSLVENKHYNLVKTLPAANKEEEENENMMILSWLLGEVDDDIINDFQIFSNIFLSEGGFITSSLDNAGFGRMSPFAGVIDDGLETTFHIGMEGLKKEEYKKAKKLILELLLQIKENGISETIIESAMDDVEADIKNVSSSKIPYGLSIILNSMGYATNGKDPLDGIDFEIKLLQARERFANKNYIKELAEKLLSSLPMVSIKFEPTTDFFKERNKLEQENLLSVSKNMTEKQKKKIKEESSILLKKQTESHNYECLPKITSTEVSRNIKENNEISIKQEKNSLPYGYIDLPTNGLSYINFNIDLSNFKQSDWKWVELITKLLPGMPTKKESWQKAMEKRALLCKNVDISLNAFNDLNDKLSGKLILEISAYHIQRKQENIKKILEEYLNNIQFKDFNRIKHILKQEIADFEQNLSNIGTSIASNEIKSNFSFSGIFQKETNGLNYINFIKKLLNSLDEKEGKEKLKEKIEKIFNKILKSKAIVYGAGNQETLELITNIAFSVKMPALTNADFKNISIKQEKSFVPKLFKYPTEVNYCHIGFNVNDLNYNNKESVYLDLAAQLLTHNFLHPIIREQGGAYGARAGFNILEGAFMMSTYRDPEVSNTYEQFKKSLDWFLEKDFTDEQLEEAKISLLQNLDKPMSVKNEFEKALSIKTIGIEDKYRQSRREAIIDAKIINIKEAFKKHIKTDEAFKAIFSSGKNFEDSNFEIVSMS